MGEGESCDLGEDDDIVCVECGSPKESKTNQILLCDGDDCAGAYHQKCLEHGAEVGSGGRLVVPAMSAKRGR